jgi:hypothetical protein
MFGSQPSILAIFSQHLELVAAFERLLHNDGSRQITEQVLVFLERLFTTGPEAGCSAQQRPVRQRKASEIRP